MAKGIHIVKGHISVLEDRNEVISQKEEGKFKEIEKGKTKSDGNRRSDDNAENRNPQKKEKEK